LARAASGIAAEGTQDIASAAGGVHVPTPARLDSGIEMGPDDHHLAGGKSPNDVRRFLREVQFPTRKENLIRTASRAGAPDDVVRCLSALPLTDYARWEDVIRDYPRLPDREDLGDRNDVGPGARG